MDLRGCNQIIDFKAFEKISVVNGVNVVGRYTVSVLSCFFQKSLVEWLLCQVGFSHQGTLYPR